MIRWIQARPWLPEILLAISTFLILGGIDVVTGGIPALLVALLASLSLLFARHLYFLSPILIFLTAALQIFESLPITAGSAGIVLAAFISGGFAPRLWREVTLATAIMAHLALGANLTLNSNLTFTRELFGEVSEAGQIFLLICLALLSISLVTLAFISGMLLMTRLTYVGTEFDRLLSQERQLKLSVEIAEQAKRFEIARDINEHVVQRISSVLSNAEGGLYAGKSNSEAALRALDKVTVSARAALQELRRLFDMLNRGTIVVTAPPGLNDLDSLASSLRERGLDVYISHFGNRFDLSTAAELAIYRIIFDALENVFKHTPKGTKATVEFSWLENGLQVLVKDNGVEVERRTKLTEDGIPEPYDANDDIDTLLEKVSGPGFTAMRDRAELYGGSLEVNKVVGVGLTVSAMFPAAGISVSSGDFD